MLVHEFLLLSLQCPIPEIHSIRDAGSRIPVAVFTLHYPGDS
jgi:hypothetical protein